MKRSKNTSIASITKTLATMLAYTKKYQTSTNH